MNKAQIREKVIQVLERLEVLADFQIGKDSLDDDLGTYGMDSLAFIKLVVEIEKIFNIEVPDEWLIYEKWDTINNVVDSLFEIIETAS